MTFNVLTEDILVSYSNFRVSRSPPQIWREWWEWRNYISHVSKTIFQPCRPPSKATEQNMLTHTLSRKCVLAASLLRYRSSPSLCFGFAVSSSFWKFLSWALFWSTLPIFVFFLPLFLFTCVSLVNYSLCIWPNLCCLTCSHCVSWFAYWIFFFCYFVGLLSFMT